MYIVRIATTLMILAVIATAGAKCQTPADVPIGHWAYAAVEDLATKGLVKGYPPSVSFFGKRTVTRYEMATIIQRVLARVDELLAKKADKSGEPQGVAPAQLEEVRHLVADFRMELTVIGTDLQKVKDQIGELKASVDAAVSTANAARQAADRAAAAAAEARGTADQAKQGVQATLDAMNEQKNQLKKAGATLASHKISGYIQSRFDAMDVGRTSLFTNAGAGGTGQTPANGGPSVGGPFYGFQVRRARLNFTGPITPRSDYRIQVDAQSGSSVSVYDANVVVRDLPVKNVTARFGMFPPPFGYELPNSSSLRESPERAFGLGTTSTDYPMFKTTVSSTGGVVTPGSVNGLFVGQQRDVGAAFVWDIAGKGTDRTQATLSVINGEGRSASGARNSNNGIDLVGRLETPLGSNRLKLGLSGYYGTFAVRGGPPAGTPAAPVAFVNADKIVAGADVRWLSPWGTSFRLEYFGGIYEATPDRAFFLPGNHAQAWYVVARHPITKKLEVVAKYDEFQPITQLGKFAAGLGRRDLIREILSGGLLYQLDDATRLRLWYARGLTPYDPSVATGPGRTRLGLLTGEVQVSF